MKVLSDKENTSSMLEKPSKKISGLIVSLFVFGFTLILASFLLTLQDDSLKWMPELIRGMMGLAFTVIFGGIIKLVFDKYQEEKNQKEKDRDEEKARQEKTKEEERIKLEKIKEFKSTVLNQLRKVFDAVDSARLLIEAHKSAKTYGESMRQSLIPSIVTLYDIKRSLVDSHEVFENTILLHLRLNIHYMIAYLQSLAEEYRDKYHFISNKQFLYEKVKEKARENFVSELIKQHPANFYSKEALASIPITDPPEWVWDSILELKNIQLFIKDSHKSPYRWMFVDFYEDCKKILKDQRSQKFPEWYESHLNRMKEIDSFNQGTQEEDTIKNEDQKLDATKADEHNLVKDLTKFLDEQLASSDNTQK